MQLKRVVITGVGAVSPYGAGTESLWQGLNSGCSAVGPLAGAEDIIGLTTKVAGVVPPLNMRQIPRKDRRSMSRMSQFAWLAAHEALLQAGIDSDLLIGGRLGISVGSTVGSVDAIEEFFEEYLRERSLEQVRSTTFSKSWGTRSPLTWLRPSVSPAACWLQPQPAPPVPRLWGWGGKT